MYGSIVVGGLSSFSDFLDGFLKSTTMDLVLVMAKCLLEGYRTPV